ncbi:MAG TPA: hypothetical protein V6D17_24380 [Candidatus Obscuribacterales bacterium]
MRIITRKGRGSAIAELGPAIFLIFVIVVFPLTTLGTLGLRYSFLIMTVRAAALDASRCKQFQEDVSPAQPSAVNTANKTANTFASKFSGISLNQVSTYISICNLPTKKITFSEAPLTAVDEVNNVYDIDVKITGEVMPLIQNSRGYWGNIPGLTAPFSVTATAAFAAENPSGLTM